MPGMVVEIGANIKPAVAGIKEVSLSLKEQQGILKNLQREYAALSTQQARSSIGLELAADIKVANAEIKRLEAGSVSSFGAIGVSATKGLSALRQLAYILPGIGVAGIFNALFSAAGDLLDFSNSVSAAAETLSGAKKEFVEATTTVFSLRKEIQLAKDGFISKDGVVKQYNETIGKATGLVHNLDEAETALEKNADAYIEMMLKKSIANIAFTKAAELAFKIEQNWQLLTEESGKHLSGGIIDNIAGTAITQKISERNAALQKQAEQYKNIGKQALDAAAEISKAMGFNFFDDNKAGKTPKADTFRPDVHIKRLPLGVEFLVDQKDLKFILAGGDKKDFKEIVEDKINKDIQGLVVKPNFKQANKLTKKQLKPFEDFGKDVSAAFQTGFQDSFSSFGEGLGNILAGKSFGSGLTDAIADLLKNLGQALIKFGIVKEGLDKIFGPGGILLPGAVAIGLGVLAVAAGSALRNIPHRATGGAAHGLTLVGERGPEIINAHGSVIPNNALRGITGAAHTESDERLITRMHGMELDIILQRFYKYKATNA